MELALPLSCYLLCLSCLGLRVAAGLHSSLVTFHNETIVESGESCQGIILVFHNDTTSLVCDDHWSVDSPLAQVVCKESGCGTPNSTWTLKSSLPRSMRAFQGISCTGNETDVSECEIPGETVQLCNPESIAAISCSHNITEARDNSSWRLARGRSSCDGHVEVLAEGVWSPVCYTHIKEMDATLFCEQMECTSHRPLFSALNKGKSPVPPVRLQCAENWTSVWECEQQVVDMCASGLTTYLQCNRSRMEESWLVWLTVCLAAIMIIVFCWVRVVKSVKGCTQCLHKHVLSLFCKKPQSRRGMHSRRNIYHREPPNLTVQETRSPPSSPGMLQDPGGDVPCHRSREEAWLLGTPPLYSCGMGCLLEKAVAF
ncbi:CD5 antigen-like isoform X2 [Hyperolius riggenbachi]|uniref:CD5 antigen-like isoform X2 n=1 Tax=Hyperolius riggenbachi TaxID=752182 RepID=UPI0035A3A813